MAVVGDAARYVALTRAPGAVASACLKPVETARPERVEQGQARVTDGPSAETKEVFGGCFIFDVDDMDEAVDVAARVPSARLGGKVEVRPLVER